MADKKISELNSAATVYDADDFALVQDGDTKQVNASAVKAYVKDGLSKSDVGLGNVDNTSDANKPVSTAIQTALNGKENADATILKSAAIGISVQAYDADLTAWAGKAAPTGDAVGTSDSQTLTNKTISGATNTLSSIGNSSLTNSSITINGNAVSLGGSTTVSAATTNTLTIGTGLSGTSFNGSAATTIAIDSSVVTLTGTQTLTNKTLTSPTINGGTVNNVAIGGTTPAAGNFTTLSSTGNTTLGDAAGDTLTINAGTTTFAQGTANGVAYLNGSKVLTTGSALTFNGTSFGVPNIDLNNGGSHYLYSTGFGSYFQLTNNANALTFGYNGSEQMRLTSTGLGIGTSSPGYKLHSVSSASSTSAFFETTTTDAYIGIKNPSTAGYIGVLSSGNMVFQTPGSSYATKLTLDSSGNLGLGVTPSAWSDLGSALDINSGGLGFYANGIQHNAYYNGTSWIYKTTGAATQLLVNGGIYRWFTAPSGTAGNAISFTQAMTLDASGNLLVGKTSAVDTGIGVFNGSNGYVNSTLASSANTGTTLVVYSTGASAYRFYVGMGGTIFATSTTISAISDQRLKENIQDLDVGLNSILALKPRKFDWKEGKGKDIKGDRGFIAQEFEHVFPDLIDTWKDEPPVGEEPYKAVRADLIPVLVKAIQELHARLEQLEAR